MRFGTLALDKNETPEDLLALAIRVIEREDARTIENLTHLAEACKAYRRARPIDPRVIEKYITPEFIQHAIIPEICDQIAGQHIVRLVQRIESNVWDETHPDQEQMPEELLARVHALRCDDSQHWKESDWKADRLEHEWKVSHGWYLGQYAHASSTMARIYDERTREDISERPQEVARRQA